MSTFLLRRVDPGFAEIIIAAKHRADAYELTREQVQAIVAQFLAMLKPTPETK